MDKINYQESVEKILSGGKVSLTFPYPSKDIMQSINALFARLLAHKDRTFLLETVVTIMRECVLNAAKANAKRVFFTIHNVSIDDSSQYDAAMKKFREEIVGDFSAISHELEKSDYRVYVNITPDAANDIEVAIVNNSAILPAELERINFRLESAKKYADFSDAYEHLYDETEGAGLGIVLTILLLKNSGIDETMFKITTDGVKTTTRFVIPHELKLSEMTSTIKETILNEINTLPTFPENIITLQQMCNDIEAPMTRIAERVIRDPALSAEILKISNSAAFSVGKKTDNINEALMRVGLKNLHSILLTMGARKIMDDRYKKFETIWNHCNRVAFYAREICSQYKLTRIQDQAVLAALLHDLGKIVLLATDPKLNTWISEIVELRKMRTSTVIEEVAIGISHSTVGEIIARKWQFPEYVIEAIQFHHAPLRSSEANQDLLYSVYLANILCGIETHKYEFYYVEEPVLERFNLNDETKFNKFHEAVKKSFENAAK